MKKVVKDVPVGTIRIKANDLQAYEKTTHSWKKSKRQFPEVKHIVDLFKAHHNLKVLLDTKDARFLKGQLSAQGMPQGARLNILPDGEKIDKAYSLFAEHLTVHDQSSDEHWDVLYQNQGGTWSYCYTLDKKAKSVQSKYKKVWQFDKLHGELYKNVSLALKNKDDTYALAMFTLLNTYMRIGNEIYYKLHHHKGLSTLKKKDITVKGKFVTFKYVGKDGVPQKIEKQFPNLYLQRLNEKLSGLKANDFVFTSLSGHPLTESCFKAAFKQYCGKEFYPHIVRSHYASVRVKNFIQGKKKLDKKEAEELFLEIAGKLGHRKFVKKEQVWKESPNVTMHHYIEPRLVEKVQELVRA